ncbi:MAG: WD40 repeat domain-containing protein [Verrucomicrobiota bacterium]
MRTLKTYALLGAGGRTPRLDRLDPTDGARACLKTLPPGSSVYAMARSPDGTRVVVGTKSGAAHVCSVTGAVDLAPECPLASHRLAHGDSPVLDVAFVTQNLVAVTNADGGCWLYDTESGGVAGFDTRHRTICALSVLGSNTLVGLATDGRLMFWNLEHRRPIDEVRGPSPPPYAALVRLRLWPAAKSLLYPARDGQLMALDLGERKLRSLSAHTGPWYLLVAAGDRCWTFGAQDGVVKTWNVDLTSAGADMPGPSSVTAGGALGRDEASLVLISENGTAGVFEVEGNEFRSRGSLAGGDYRVYLPPDPTAVRVYRDVTAQAQVQSVVQEIRRSSDDNLDTGALYERLEHLGYPHLARALQTDLAFASGNLPAALRHSSALAAMLPRGEPKSAASLFRYAELLEKAWMFPEATEVLRQVSLGSPVPGAEKQLQHVTRCGKAMVEDPLTVCEPDLPIPVLCDCASAAGKRFQGNWLFKRLRPLVCPGTEISADELLREYNRVRRKEKPHLPAATTRVINYISRQGVSASPSVVLVEKCPSSAPTFGLCLRLAKGGRQSVLNPLVIYHVPTSSGAVSVQEHNDRARDLYVQMKGQDVIKSSIKEVLNVSILAIRRLLTAKPNQQQTTME